MFKSRVYAGLMLASMVVGLVPVSGPAITAEEPSTPTIQQGSTAATTPDEAAIRASSAAFAKAFNAGDAKTIAARWTEDGEYVDQEGNRYSGRAAIQKEYEQFFAQYPGIQIQVKIDSVKMLSSETALIEGTTTLGAADQPSPVSAHFLAIHVKQNDQWRVASVREVRVEIATNYVNVADFEKLIGSWTSQNGSTVVAMNCRWIANKKFIERSFSVSENGSETMSGTQIIGWNPAEQQITSWLFDSTGGHDLATWTPQKTGWMSQSNGITGDGTPTTATSVLTHVDENSMKWKSINRTLGNEPLADSGEVVINRVTSPNKGR